MRFQCCLYIYIDVVFLQAARPCSEAGSQLLSSPSEGGAGGAGGAAERTSEERGTETNQTTASHALRSRRGQ